MSLLAPRALHAAVRASGVAEGPVQLAPAGACCLSAAALLGAPPGLLEFLCRVPWDLLTGVDSSGGADINDILREAAQSSASTGPARAALVNLPLDAAMLDVLLSFLCLPQVSEFLPPVLRGLAPQAAEGSDADPSLTDASGRLTLAGASALLDGATPLHCAALRGQAAAVEQLLLSGADVTLTTAAGQVPLELLPKCRWVGGQHTCHCQAPGEAAALGKCSVDVAWQLLLLHGALWLRGGLVLWAVMALLSALAAVGVIFREPPQRSAKLAKHLQWRTRHVQATVQKQTEGLLRQIRQEAQQGRAHLGLSPDGSARLPPASAPGAAGGNCQVVQTEDAYQCFVRAVHAVQRLDRQRELEGDLGAAPELGLTERAELYRLWAESMLLQHRACACNTCAETLSQVASMAHLQVSRHFAAAEEAIESSLALAPLPSLEVSLSPGRGSEREGGPDATATPEGPAAPAPADRTLAGVTVLSGNGADLSALRELLLPLSMPAGLRGEGGQGGAAAPGDAAGEGARATAEWCGVGVNLARIVGAHMSVLVEVECAVSPSPSCLACAQQCLTQWRKLSSQGLLAIAGCAASAVTDAERLEAWARQAHSSIRVVEALCDGSLLPDQTIEEALGEALATVELGPLLGPSRAATEVRLASGVTAERVEGIRRALQYHSRHADPETVRLATEVLAASEQELATQERLSHLTSAGDALPDAEVEELEGLIGRAAGYPRLDGLRERAVTVLDRCRASQEALRNLRGAMAAVLQHGDGHSAAAGDHGPGSDTERSVAVSDAASRDLSGQCTPGKEPSVLEIADSSGPEKLEALRGAAATLESAMLAVQQASMGASLSDARRLLRTLQAKVEGVEAFATLREAMDGVLGAHPGAAGDGGSTPRAARLRLRAAITAAESAIQSLKGVVCSGEVAALQERLSVARTRSHAERAIESLDRVASSLSQMSDLHKLDLAIREAEKYADRDGVSVPSLELARAHRAELEQSQRAQQALYRACLQLKHADKAGREAAEEAVRDAIARALEFLDAGAGERRLAFAGEYLRGEVARARGQLESWKAAESAQVELMRVLATATAAREVEAAIAEASGAGVRVSRARKVLRAMQALEAALGQTALRGTTLAAVEEAVKTARMAAVNEAVVDGAEAVLADRRLRFAEQELEAALSTWAAGVTPQARAAATGAMGVARDLLQREAGGPAGGGSERQSREASVASVADSAAGDGGSDTSGAAGDRGTARVRALLERLEGLVKAQRVLDEKQEKETRLREAEARKEIEQRKEKLMNEAASAAAAAPGAGAPGKDPRRPEPAAAKGNRKRTDTRQRIAVAIHIGGAGGKRDGKPADRDERRGRPARVQSISSSSTRAERADAAGDETAPSPPQAGRKGAGASRAGTALEGPAAGAPATDSELAAGAPRAAHQRNPTWAQLEDDLLRETTMLARGDSLTRGDPLADPASALASSPGRAWAGHSMPSQHSRHSRGNSAAHAVHRGAEGSHSPSAWASASDLHAELLQLLLPDGQGAVWGTSPPPPHQGPLFEDPLGAAPGMDRRLSAPLAEEAAKPLPRHARAPSVGAQGAAPKGGARPPLFGGGPLTAPMPGPGDAPARDDSSAGGSASATPSLSSFFPTSLFSGVFGGIVPSIPLTPKNDAGAGGPGPAPRKGFFGTSAGSPPPSPPRVVPPGANPFLSSGAHTVAQVEAFLPGLSDGGDASERGGSPGGERAAPGLPGEGGALQSPGKRGWAVGPGELSASALPFTASGAGLRGPHDSPSRHPGGPYPGALLPWAGQQEWAGSGSGGVKIPAKRPLPPPRPGVVPPLDLSGLFGGGVGPAGGGGAPGSGGPGSGGRGLEGGPGVRKDRRTPRSQANSARSRQARGSSGGSRRTPPTRAKGPRPRGSRGRALKYDAGGSSSEAERPGGSRKSAARPRAGVDVSVRGNAWDSPRSGNEGDRE